MTFFCFVETDALTVPHMEVLTSDNRTDALIEARELMGLHASAVAAHVFLGEERIDTIIREAAAA